MQYNYNNIFLENRQMTNLSSLHWMSMIAALISVVWIFSLFHIFHFHRSISDYSTCQCSDLTFAHYIK